MTVENGGSVEDAKKGLWGCMKADFEKGTIEGGSEKQLNLLTQFMQDYLHFTRPQRKSGGSNLSQMSSPMAARSHRIEDNLTLWKRTVGQRKSDEEADFDRSTTGLALFFRFKSGIPTNMFSLDTN